MAHQTLMEAAINNNTTDLETELQNLSEGEDLEWLLTACRCNSVDFVSVVARSKPELTWWKNQDNWSAIHVACQNGNVGIVEALTKSTPDLCFLRNQEGRIPLHVATIRENVPIMKMLLKACPQSLAEVTSHGETALQLAAKCGNICAFKVLLEETLKQKQEKILHIKDYEGNNVFHTAVLCKLFQILRLLLVENPKHGPLVRVNSRNGRGLTALDLHFHNFTQQNDRSITVLLHEAGARRGQSSHSQSVPNSIMQKTKFFSKSSALMTVSGLIAGSTYSSIFNLGDSYIGIKAVSGRDILLHPGLLPNVFYSIMLMTVAFTASMVGFVVPLWSMIKGWSFCLKALPLLGLGALFFSYAFTVKEKVPEFWITTESFKLSSFWLVWLYSQSLILILFVIWLVTKLILSLICKPKQPEDE